MVLSTRPDWTRSTTGTPIDCVVRVNGGSLGDFYVERIHASALSHTHTRAHTHTHTYTQYCWHS